MILRISVTLPKIPKESRHVSLPRLFKNHLETSPCVDDLRVLIHKIPGSALALLQSINTSRILDLVIFITHFPLCILEKLSLEP
jgi:hypothetical protein